MGNALEASKAALAKDLIGGNPLEAKFAAIDAGIKGVQDWKKNIDLQRLTLKQNTQAEIREAEEAAKKQLGDNETANSKILEALETYKNQRLTQEKLVRIGSLNPDDNLIFEQNGQQTFETFIDFTNKFGEELELTKKRAKGYYKDNEDGTQTFVPPISGGVEAANQKLVTQIGTLSGVDFGIDDKGMGTVSFYKMKINPKTRTYEPVLDDEGNPVLAEGENTTSVLALKHDNNTRAQRVYLTKDIQEFSQGPGAASYQEMMRLGNMSGVIVDDLKQRPGMGQFIETEVASKYGTIDATASLFVDNGIGGKVVPFNEWDGDKLYDNSGKDVSNETITIIGIDENFNEKEYTVKKYTKQTVANNNKMVTEMSDEQIEASHAFARKGYVDSLQQKISGGKRDDQFSKDREYAREDKKEEEKFKGDFEVASRIAAGGNERVKTLNQLKNSSVYTNENGYNQVKEFSEELELDTNGDGNKDSFGLEVTVLNKDGETEVLQLITRDENGSPLSEDEMENNVLNIMGRDPVTIENMRESVGDNYKRTQTQKISLTENAYNKMSAKLKSRIESQAGGKNNVVVKDGKVFKKVTKDGQETLEQIQVKDDRKVNVRPEVAVTYSGMSDLAFGSDKDTNELITGDDLFERADEASNTKGSKVKKAFDKVYTAAIKKYGLPKGELTLEVDNTGGANDRITIRKNGVIVVQHEKDGENVSKAKTYLDEYIRKATKSKGGSGGKRTIVQIMKEDGVSRSEAIKIYTNQN